MESRIVLNVFIVVVFVGVVRFKRIEFKVKEIRMVGGMRLVKNLFYRFEK